jgi:uncharacterized protein YndB with AHSA1/START domain
MSSTRITRHINAPRAAVYRALLDARAVATWKVPTGMTSHVHAFDAREGGSFRISLTYDAPTGPGEEVARQLVDVDMAGVLRSMQEARDGVLRRANFSIDLLG